MHVINDDYQNVIYERNANYWCKVEPWSIFATYRKFYNFSVEFATVI